MLNFENKKIKILSAFFVAMFLYFAPLFVFAGGIIPCDGVKVKCDFNALIKLVQNIIEFIIKVSPFVAAVAFAWAGWKYITAGSNTGQIGEAHKIFSSVAYGFIIILSAWLIVKAILVGLGAESWAIRLGR